MPTNQDIIDKAWAQAVHEDRISVHDQLHTKAQWKKLGCRLDPDFEEFPIAEVDLWITIRGKGGKTILLRKPTRLYASFQVDHVDF